MENKIMQKKLDITDAVTVAQKYFRALRESFDGNIEGLGLEEIELSEDKKYWLVTMGFFIKNPRKEESFCFNSKRMYRIIKINSKTGEIKSIKRRKK